MTDTPSKTKVSSKIVYQNPWITVREDQTRDLAGNLGVYSYMESRDSCMVVAVDDKERIYFVRGFRYPSQSFGWELPGGGGDSENLLTASKRELEEETSITAQSWNKLGEVYVCNGLMTEKMADLPYGVESRFGAAVIQFQFFRFSAKIHLVALKISALFLVLLYVVFQF